MIYYNVLFISDINTEPFSDDNGNKINIIRSNSDCDIGDDFVLQSSKYAMFISIVIYILIYAESLIKFIVYV